MLSKIAPFTVAAASLFAAFAGAQSTVIIPTVAQGADGNSSSGWPFDVANMDIQ